jgi:hypothetical protein
MIFLFMVLVPLTRRDLHESMRHFVKHYASATGSDAWMHLFLMDFPGIQNAG